MGDDCIEHDIRISQSSGDLHGFKVRAARSKSQLARWLAAAQAIRVGLGLGLLKAAIPDIADIARARLQQGWGRRQRRRW